MLASSSQLANCALLKISFSSAGARFVLLLAAVLMASSGAFAQNYSPDARSVGMGGETGLGVGNLAASLVPSDRKYTAITIPLGLVQVLPNLEVFDPTDPGFDPLAAIDYVGNPLHYSFNRAHKKGTADFLKNIVDSGFSRDLNDYRGFAPPEHMVIGGVLAPNWGYTFKFHKGDNDSFQGIYLGAGPYISLQNDLRFDPALIAILESPVDVTVPANTTFYANDVTSQQASVAITGGYRAKIGFSDSTAARDGVYLAVNFNYLIGVHQDVVGFDLQIPTDGSGLVAVTPAGVPLTVDYLYSTSGRGFSTDAGVVIVKNGWEIGAGANDIANRMDWTNHHHKSYTLTNLVTGADFTATTLPVPSGAIRKELPIEYVSNLGYSAGRWTVRTDWSYGVQKLSAHAGAEYRLGLVALRGGTRYSVQQWNPTGGVGMNFTRRFGIDVGVFGNSTNLEQKRNISVALSLRIDHSTE